jgi:hypothetical protein
MRARSAQMAASPASGPTTAMLLGWRKEAASRSPHTGWTETCRPTTDNDAATSAGTALSSTVGDPITGPVERA